MDVVRSLVYETIGFLVTNHGSSFVDFLGGFPSDPFTFDLQSYWIWPFLSHLRQVIYDLANEPLPEPLQFSLRRILKSTCFKELLTDCSMAKVYAFGSES